MAIIYISTYSNIVTLIISLPGNLFIIFVNIQEFCKNRRLLLSNQLIFGFSVISLLHGLVDVCQWDNHGYDKYVTQIFIYFNMCTLSFSTLLSVHFCLKIVHINHWLYIALQKRFHTFFALTLTTLVLGGILVYLSPSLNFRGDLLNITSTDVSKRESSTLLLWIFTAISILHTLLCSVSTLAIVISLFKHMKQIQENTEGSRSPNLEAHIHTVKTVTTLLATNILIFSSMISSYVLFAVRESSWIHICSLLIYIFHIFSSYFLIRGNKKLDTALVEILNQCSCFSSK
ncbi:hypothetical protein GDO78_010228 [Eleutherodactylus coqui]|uniref:Taste receptor type 2 n=1 Tax=Eleutherodactylus coqui TaxID=57060 RepID=A0A8J6K6U9_ELECQ|nr:hypothetical protein GDO78_010228 [Eleutherodactylus coqui]